MMTNSRVSFARVLPLVPVAVLTSGCEAIQGIFKAGVWTGVILVVLAIGLIGFVISRVRA